MNKTLVQEHFGKTAADYLTSKPHAKGKSLERLVDLTGPRGRSLTRGLLTRGRRPTVSGTQTGVPRMPSGTAEEWCCRMVPIGPAPLRPTTKV